ncbi:MAG TPA: cytochrome c oxidase subunit II [Thermoanaerobaculia bacterium]|jgi:cytochrome c oxidase subunit 2|nr:cytochrome c oxidase subunit II [Thermoanaerobaculia bacterium]
MNDFPLFPEQASSVAPLVDGLYLGLVVITGAVSLLIWFVIFYFAVKYRRRPNNELAQEQEPPVALEMTWTIVPTIIFMGIFIAGAWLFFRLNRVPSNALEVYATGRQWMWKFQHPTGQREINTLHVPVGRPVKITLASEDVIHSLWFPSFRVKMDVLPNRFRVMWFEATKTGSFHIFCAEYCGTKHSGMIGTVVVMEPTEYQRWLAGGSEGSLASQGEKLFAKYACNTCHMDTATGRGPVLAGLYGQTRPLAGGENVVVDDNYIRESILNPTAKIAAGFQPLMPTFQGQVSEDDLIRLLSYVKSIPAPGAAQTPQVESVQSQLQSSGATNTQGNQE